MSDMEDTPRKSSRVRRPSAKLRVSDDEDMEDVLPWSSKPTTNSVSDLFADDVQVNIDDAPSSSSQLAPKRKKSTSDAPRPRKRVKAQAGDGEDWDDSGDDSPDGNRMEDDDYLAMEEVSDSRTKANKSSNASKRKPSGKTKGAPKEKEIVIRDQRKIVPPLNSIPTSSRPSETSGSLDSPGTSSSPAPASVAQKKLPNFKKREGAGPSTPKPKPPVAPKEAQVLKTPSTIPVATNASSRTVTKGQDMNLNDPNEYKNLFKTAGNTASKNRNEEGKAIARRKEIEKLRQEAKARQTAEMNKNKFDLQEQLEAISAYEEEMAEETNGNFLLYPNFLGVRWRMDWEQKLKEPGEV